MLSERARWVMVDLRVRYANSVGGGAFGASKRGVVVTVEFGGGGGGCSSIDIVEAGGDCGPEEGGVCEDGDTIVTMLYLCFGSEKNAIGCMGRRLQEGKRS